MDISEHLEELRGRIIKSLIGIAVALAFCLFFQDKIMWMVTRPHRIAMERLSKSIDEKRQNRKEDELTAAEEIQAAIEKLKEKNPEAATAIELLAREVMDFEQQTKKRRFTLQTIKYQEAFISYLKACIVAAIILASPWVFLQLWAFVGSGLYPREKRYVLLYMPFSFIFFAGGVTFGYLLLIPEGMTYLAKYANPELVSVQITLGFYLSFFLLLTVALGLVFQLPLVMMFLAKTGIVSSKDFAKYRKYAILAAPIIGAVLTPPDPVTQLLLASPMFLLYEFGIQLSRLTGRKKKEAAK
jgi:Tat protein translocase TatC